MAKTKLGYLDIVDLFDHKGRTCLVVKADFRATLGFVCHAGYVSVLPKNHGKLHTGEFNYSGSRTHLDSARIPEGMWFWGFDTAAELDNPDLQTASAVRSKTIQLADEMIRKGI